MVISAPCRILSFLLIITLSVPPLPAWSAPEDDLPDIGSASGALFTPAQEKKLGKTFMRYIRATQDVILDPVMDDYINQLGNKLVENSNGKGSRFHFFLVNSPQINAYAGPGGYIGIYTGLVLTTQSEAELAAVIAHEITHVTQKHLQRAWYAASNMSLVQGAALVAAILLGAAAGGDAAVAATVGAQAALQQKQINFTRHNEQEADRLGIVTLYKSHFDPHAMPVFFTRMGRANRSYGAQLPEFLRTHPVTNARIADAMDRAEKYPYLQTQDSFRYLLLRAALKEKTFGDVKDAIRHFQKTLKDGRYRNPASARYGLTLALMRDRQFKRAAQEANKLLEQYPDTLEFIVASAHIDMENHQQQRAISNLEAAIHKAPLSYPLHITLAESYLRTGHNEKAYRSLKKWARIRPQNARIYQLLAQASAALGNQPESHEYMASYYYLMGALESSAMQLKIALKNPKLDFYQTARLESQLAKVQAEIDELKKDKH